VLEQLVEVGGVGVEPDDVGESHAGGGQDGLQVVEGCPDLGGHVAWMLGAAVVVDRVLAAADEYAALSFDELGGVEPQRNGPEYGVDGLSLHGCCLL
jgi:hypothetical protein